MILEPALTPKEWSEVLEARNQILGYAVARSGLGGIVGPACGEKALGALALAGYFTWEHVKALRWQAHCLNEFVDGFSEHEALSEIADLIEALLPPHGYRFFSPDDGIIES